MRNLLLFFALLVIMLGCRAKINSDQSDEYFQKALEFKNCYSFTDDDSYLDSALLALQAADCDRLHAQIAMHKVDVYYRMGNYEKAVKEIGALPDSIFRPTVMKNVYINQLRSKSASNDDEYTKFINNILIELESYRRTYKMREDSLLAIPGNSMWLSDCEEYTFFVDYFYYKSLIFPEEEVIRELDSLREAISGNENYFEEMKRIVSKDENYTVSVLFE